MFMDRHVVLRLCATLLLPPGVGRQRARQSLRFWNEIPTPWQESRGQEKTEGDEIPLQASPSNTPTSLHVRTSQMPFLNVLCERTCFYHCSSTLSLTLWQHFCPEGERKIPRCEEREKLYSLCVSFITYKLHSSWPHTQQTGQKFCSRIFRNGWPWNAFTFHSTRGDNNCLREVF